MKHQPPALSQTVTFGLQRAAEARTDLRGYLLAATTRCSLCRQAAASGPGSGPCSWAATRAANLCSSSGWASLRGERADRGVRAELRPSQSLTKLSDRPDSCPPPPQTVPPVPGLPQEALCRRREHGGRPGPRPKRPPRGGRSAADGSGGTRCCYKGSAPEGRFRGEGGALGEITLNDPKRGDGKTHCVNLF